MIQDCIDILDKFFTLKPHKFELGGVVRIVQITNRSIPLQSMGSENQILLPASYSRQRVRPAASRTFLTPRSAGDLRGRD